MLSMMILAATLVGQPERLSPRMWVDQLPGGRPAAEAAPESEREREPERWSWWRAAAWHGGPLAVDLAMTEHQIAAHGRREANPLPGMDHRAGRVAWLSVQAVASVGVDYLLHRIKGRKAARIWRGLTGAYEGSIIATRTKWSPMTAIGIGRDRPQVLHEIVRAPAREGMSSAGNCLPLIECRGGGPCVLP